MQTADSSRVKLLEFYTEEFSVEANKIRTSGTSWMDLDDFLFFSVFSCYSVLPSSTAVFLKVGAVPPPEGTESCQGRHEMRGRVCCRLLTQNMTDKGKLEINVKS